MEGKLTDFLLLQIGSNTKISFKIDTELINTNNKKIFLKDIFGVNKRNLILKITRNSCNSCVEQEINMLNKLFENNKGNLLVFIFSDDYSIKEMKIIKKKYNIQFPLFSIKSDYFKKNIVEKLNKPYYFQINENLETVNTYTPDVVFPEISKKYYEMIMYLSLGQ